MRQIQKTLIKTIEKCVFCKKQKVVLDEKKRCNECKEQYRSVMAHINKKHGNAINNLANM